MKTEVSKEQIEAYQRDGFMVQREFLSPDEVREMKAAVLEAVEELGRRKVAGRPPEDDWLAGDDFYDHVFTQRLNLWLINDTIRKYMLDPALGRMASELEGVDGMRMWHDQTLIKEPFGNPTAWHLDNPYWSFSSRHATSLWIALEDATMGNGCMWFIPGTHKMATFEGPGIGADMGGIFKMYPEMANIDPVAAPMKAGDCSFHNGLTAHGAGANMTRTRRIAMTCAYMPIGCTFNGQRNVLPQLYVDSLKKGDVLENDAWNPVLWQRSAS